MLLLLIVSPKCLSIVCLLLRQLIGLCVLAPYGCENPASFVMF